MKPLLQILICTFGRDGLDRVARMQLPPLEGLSYLVSCQSEPMPIPAALQRPDVEIHFSPTRGLSHNRNAALDLASAPYALIADDDLLYSHDGLQQLMQAIKANPELDIFTFRIERPGHKGVYPDAQFPLDRKLKNYNIVSVEIGLKLESVRHCGLRFNPHFGIGAPLLTAAEEGVFLIQARRSGLRGCFFPITVGSHPGDTTSQRHAAAPGFLRAQGAYLLLRHGIGAMPRLPLAAWRASGSSLRALWHLAHGALYAALNRRKIFQK